MENKPERMVPPNFFKGLIFWLVAGIGLLVLLHFFSSESQKEEISYSNFREYVQKGQLTGTLKIKDGWVYGKLQDGRSFRTFFPEIGQLTEFLNEHQVHYEIVPVSTFWANMAVATIPVILIFLLLWFFINRQVSSEGNRVMSFARSRPVIPSGRNKVTFEDVAGCAEAKEELREIIEFLRDPKKFQRLGGKIPKGVLLIGPPGTGKTLLAKAVAGEANVPFLSMSGSDFVEMFVGVGAARVRDLFRQAKRMSPAIIFIDEIDAVGRQRFAGLGGGHDEREQTLNQLLVEMDGFQTDEAVIVMAATNRPDVLDPALTRTGRFDRTVVVNLPDIKEREAILKVHTRNKPLAPSVDLAVLARGTPGLSGADLANIVNEAALLAAKKNKNVIEMSDLETAKDKVLMGTERRSLVISEEERRIIAYHEAAHTLLQKNLPEVYPVHKVTIIPRGRALGLTHVFPEKDRFLESNEYFHNTLVALLAGRAAEKLVFGRMYTGSENDLRIATEIARRMVCEWGMSEKLGPVSFHEQEAVFLGRDLVQQRQHSEVTSREIDEEIRKILENAQKKAEDFLTAKREQLDLLARALLERETLSSEEIDEVLGTRREGDRNGPGKDREGSAAVA